MRAAVGGTKFLRKERCVLLKVSRELSGVATHLGGKPSSRPHGWSAILCQFMHPNMQSTKA